MHRHKLGLVLDFTTFQQWLNQICCLLLQQYTCTSALMTFTAVAMYRYCVSLVIDYWRQKLVTELMAECEANLRKTEETARLYNDMDSRLAKTKKELDEMLSQTLDLRVQTAICGNRLIRLDSPIVMSKLQSLCDSMTSMMKPWHTNTVHGWILTSRVCQYSRICSFYIVTLSKNSDMLTCLQSVTNQHLICVAHTLLWYSTVDIFIYMHAIG